MYEDILIPTDGSTGAEQAVAHVLELAETFGARVHALYVVEPIHAADYRSGQLVSALRAEGEAATERIAARGESRGLSVRTAVETGVPHHRILDYVDEHDIDLVVMGTHGRTGLDRYLLGSVTEKIVRQSDVPVFTIAVRSHEE